MTTIKLLYVIRYLFVMPTTPLSLTVGHQSLVLMATSLLLLLVPLHQMAGHIVSCALVSTQLTRD